MKRVLAVYAVAAFLFALMVQAQAPPMPKPGPELKKLDYFMGTWKMEGEIKAEPLRAGRKNGRN